KERQRISLASIAAHSKTIDPTGQGVSESSVLNNDEARTLYEQHRTWKGAPRYLPNATKMEQIARIIPCFDLCQSGVVVAVRRFHIVRALIHHHVDIAPSRRRGMQGHPVPLQARWVQRVEQALQHRPRDRPGKVHCRGAKGTNGCEKLIG